MRASIRLGLLLSAWGLFGCGDDGEGAAPPDRILTHALANFASDLETAPTWRKIAGRHQRLFTCKLSCRLEFELPPQVAIRGEKLVLTTGVWAPEPGAGARFRVEIDGLAIHDAPGRHGLRDALEIELPADRSPLARLVLDAQLVGDDSLAMWIEPTLVQRVARERLSPVDAWNLLLVTSDTTRLDELSVYGGPVPTPSLERLAQEGIRFDDVHSAAFGTLPSHATLFTSQHAREHGAIGNGWLLTSRVPTLAEALRQRGYTTAGFVSTTVLDRRLGLGRGFDLYDEPYTQQRRGNLTLALVSDWLNRNPLEPFFLFVHLYDPHQPYSPPPPFDALEGLNVDVAAVDQLLASLGPGKSGAVSADAVLRADRAALPAVGAVARARYRGEIAFVDAQLARLRALLEARGLLDRTLVVFTADHGENFLDRGPSLAFDHAGLHAEVTRLPLLMRFPDGRQAGTVSDRLTSSLDVAPTLLAALGVEPPEEWRGSSLLDADAESMLVLEASLGKEIAVRSKRFLYRALQAPWIDQPKPTRKLGYRPGRPEQLYEREPGQPERRNVFADGHPALPALRARLERFLSETPKASTRRLDDEEHLEALRALGYLDDPEEE